MYFFLISSVLDMFYQILSKKYVLYMGHQFILFIKNSEKAPTHNGLEKF